jgi:branched-chain amino acid transport system substrate-binding protein
MNSVSDAILHPLKSTVFTVMPLFDQQLATVIPFAMKQQGAGTAAVVYLDGYSPNILPAAKYAIEAAGGAMIQSIGVALSTTNWGPTVIRLKEANPDFVFLVLTTPGSGQLVAEMANQGFAPKKGVAGAYQMADAIYQQFAGPAGNGTIAMSPVVPPSDPKAAECNSMLPAGETPTFFSVLACASAKIMVEVLKAAGPDASASSILTALQKVNGAKAPEFSGVAYSDDHLLVRSMYVWKNGAAGPSLASPDPTPIPDSSKWVK